MEFLPFHDKIYSTLIFQLEFSRVTVGKLNHTEQDVQKILSAEVSNAKIEQFLFLKFERLWEMFWTRAFSQILTS